MDRDRALGARLEREQKAMLQQRARDNAARRAAAGVEEPDDYQRRRPAPPRRERLARETAPSNGKAKR